MGDARRGRDATAGVVTRVAQHTRRVYRSLPHRCPSFSYQPPTSVPLPMPRASAHRPRQNSEKAARNRGRMPHRQSAARSGCLPTHRGVCYIPFTLVRYRSCLKVEMTKQHRPTHSATSSRQVMRGSSAAHPALSLPSPHCSWTVTITTNPCDPYPPQYSLHLLHDPACTGIAGSQGKNETVTTILIGPVNMLNLDSGPLSPLRHQVSETTPSAPLSPFHLDEYTGEQGVKRPRRFSIRGGASPLRD